MRRFWILAGAALLAGCNPPTAATQQQTACNCHGSVTTANPAAETQRFVPPPGGETHRHHRARYSHGGGYRAHRRHDRYAERSYVRSTYDDESYSYRSTSHVYHEDGGYQGGGAHAYASSGGYAGGGGYADGFVDASDRDGWQDGYGRWHSRSALGGRATRARLDPWHGYDIDCPHR